MQIPATNIPGIAAQAFATNASQQRSSSTAAPEVGANNKPDQQNNNTKPASKAELQDAVESGNNFLKTVTNAIEFSIDKESGDTVVKVVDTATKEVVRQFPSEEMLAIAKALDKIQGLLIKQQA